MSKFNQSIKEIVTLLTEMPDFALQGKKYETEDGLGIKDFDHKALKENIIVYYMEKHFMFPPNYFLIYFMDTEESAELMDKGEITPAIIMDSTYDHSPFEAIWRKKSTDSRILGTVQGFVDEEEDELVIKFMTVRSKARRQTINSRMIDSLKEEFGNKKIRYEDITKQGGKFKSSYEGE